MNSGVWIGRAKEARIMCQELKNRLQAQKKRDDQEFMTYMFWEKNYGIALDYYSSLIKSMHESPNDVGYGPHRFYEKNLNTEPLFWHFNGGGKQIYPQMESRMFYNVESEAAKRFWNDKDNTLEFDMGKLDEDFRENDDAKVVWGKEKFETICPEYVRQRKSKYANSG